MDEGILMTQTELEQDRPAAGWGQHADMNAFYYITHVDNLLSIIEHGILSHDQVPIRGLAGKTVYDPEIVKRRAGKTTPTGKPLTSYANVYIQPRNAMLYRVICESGADHVVVLQVRPDVRHLPGAFVTTGNAAADKTEFHPAKDYANVLGLIRSDLTREYWRDEDGSKRRMMAECLVPDAIPPDYIQEVLVANDATADKVKKLLFGKELPVVVQRYQFFLPLHKVTLTPNLALVAGDLFFSHKQTLTVSVNTVGVMGKGLASRAKYQFPDLYVYYQDLCKTKKLKMGRPHIYKPETSLYVQLADAWNPQPGTRPTQFLLFPTKHHWRDRSDLDGIVKGLEWLVETYDAEGVESLAIPALGCGLGRLEWKDVGPVMCRLLDRPRVPVWIYLPAEKKVDKDYLTKDFLLG
ncbi:MAG: DarT ssDNA thymidine ADP-ribosyltransferase family protein [Vicinamibacteria bacterium]